MDRAEKLGLGAATAGHVILFGLLSVGFLATPNPLKIERHPVEVTFADDVGLEATAPRESPHPPANLGQDGALLGEPRVIGPTGVTPSNRAQADLFVERAVTAVKRAAPYNFPKDFYAAWKTIKPQLYEGL